MWVGTRRVDEAVGLVAVALRSPTQAHRWNRRGYRVI